MQSLHLGSVSFFALVVDVEPGQVQVWILEGSEGGRLAIGFAIESGVGTVAARALRQVN